jgi:hypothetical protein
MNPDCDPVEQQKRQDFLEDLYLRDERSKDKSHPLYGLYTNLFQQHQIFND